MKLLSISLLALLSIASASDDSCNKPCRNEGACRLGIPSFGYATGIDEEDPNQLPPVGESSNSNRMYCECPAGYAGPHCEIKLVMCAENQSKCFNGADCIQAQDDRGGVFSHCECDASNTDFSSRYASSFCQHTATVYCTTQQEGETSARHTFCTNGGRCNKLVDASEEHQGCVCGTEWEGAHCQFFSDSIISMDGPSTNSPDSSGSPAGIIIGVLAGVLIAAVTGMVAWRSHRTKKKEADMAKELELRRANDPYGIESNETVASTSEIL